VNAGASGFFCRPSEGSAPFRIGTERISWAHG
jgi:hypothetical protein